MPWQIFLSPERRAYRSAWHSFEAWCRSLGREPLAADPDTRRTTENVGAIKNLHSSADLTARAAVSASVQVPLE